MKTNTYLAAMMTASVLATGSFAAQQTTPTPAQQRPGYPNFDPRTRDENRKVREAREKHGLHAAAKLAGAYVEAFEIDLDLAAGDFVLLADLSDVVVRGLIKSNRSHIIRSKDGGWAEPVETIVTDYGFQVLDVYKGDVKLKLTTRDITVRIPGGGIQFDDGTSAEIRVYGFARPANQEEFVLFLNQDRSQGNVYALAFGRQGMFQIMPEGWVSPRARMGTPIAKKAKRNFQEFVKQLTEAIADAERARKKFGRE